DLLFIGLFTPDGISLYDSLSEEMVRDFFLASSAAIVEISRSLSEHAGLGSFNMCLMRSENGCMVLATVGEDVYLGLGVRDYNSMKERVDSLISELRSYLGGGGSRVN
ncbi:MAG: hypothetical protein QI199_06620, partial [Candidatus Korarchaeota archaeon]|nr:hypothetical protein [Candidatus Korarchaeota archaeon]